MKYEICDCYEKKKHGKVRGVFRFWMRMTEGSRRGDVDRAGRT